MPPNLTKIADALTPEELQFSVANYVIDHIGSTATTTDGMAGVFLQVGSEVQQAPYLDSLTSPVAGQTVRVLIVNGSPTILGRPVGLPAI
jgi:hypothetical protein